MAYALASGGPELLWVFLIVEFTWGVLQLAPWLAGRFRNRHRRRI
jgi:hypothetical protein